LFFIQNRQNQTPKNQINQQNQSNNHKKKPDIFNIGLKKRNNSV